MTELNQLLSFNPGPKLLKSRCDLQTTASRGPMVKAMLQKEKGMGVVPLGAVALQSATGWE